VGVLGFLSFILLEQIEKEKPFNYEGFSLKLNVNELGSDSDKA